MWGVVCEEGRAGPAEAGGGGGVSESWGPGSQEANTGVERHEHTLRFYPHGSREPLEDFKGETR